MNYQDVKQLRIECGLTQTAMSSKFGIPLRTVSDWERSLREPPEWVCRLLCKELTRFQAGEE